MNKHSYSKAYRHYLDAKCLPTPDGRYTPDAVVGMQQAILGVLRSNDQLPNEMRQDLAFAFEHLCTGIAVDLLTPTKRPGGREPPIAKIMQEAAIRYLRWVDDGRLTDARPIATVAQSFQVAERTVRNWRKSWIGRPTPSLHDDFGQEEVTMIMKATGKQYRRFIPKPKKGW